jgi:hypothetical protein
MDILRTHRKLSSGRYRREGIVGKVSSGRYRREGLAGKSFLRPPDEFLAELRGGNATVADVE